MDERFQKADERKHERKRENAAMACVRKRERERERERIFVYGKPLNNNIPRSKSY
jgi:hypothetical protein